jgi:hypothetical protein
MLSVAIIPVIIKCSLWYIVVLLNIMEYVNKIINKKIVKI